MVQEFYVTLYTWEQCMPCSLSSWKFPTLPHTDPSWLNQAISLLEIKVAIFQMGALKAPGPDRHPPGFFQKFWYVLEEPVTEEVLRVFNTSIIPPGWNTSILCLIPKSSDADSLAQFRPISLCNVLTKGIYKVLANHLRPLMTKLTGQCQSSFIPRRSTSNNIMIAQEVIHSLHRRWGRNGTFIVKVDLEKAYDRVDWGFLEQVLMTSGFKENFRRLVLSCISSTEVAVNWNGELLPPFLPSRGLK